MMPIDRAVAAYQDFVRVAGSVGIWPSSEANRWK
jgi:hypothetical protein